MLSSWHDVAGSSWQPFEKADKAKQEQEVNFQFQNFSGRSRSVGVEDWRFKFLEFGLRC